MSGIFADRATAGKRLARSLKVYENHSDTIVLALPTGVIVAYEVARALKLPLDVLVIRKLIDPQHPDVELGLVGSEGVVYTSLSDRVDDGLDLDVRNSMIEAEREALVSETLMYRGNKESLGVEGKTVLLIDEGIESGVTIRNALEVLQMSEPAYVVVAVPVASVDAWLTVQDMADEVVCLWAARPGAKIGSFYEHFDEVPAAQIKEMLSSQKVSKLTSPSVQP